MIQANAMSILLLGIAAVVPAFGQQTSTPGEAAASDQPADKDESPRARVIRQFNKSAPKIGDRLPDISAYDASGNEVSLLSLEGEYRVLVFGCLT